MIFEILLAEYIGISLFNTIIPSIRREKARKNVIKMFEENGYDVDRHYINILFKHLSPDRSSKEEMDYDLAKGLDTFLRYIPFLHLHNMLLNVRYLIGDYSDTINHYYDAYWDMDQYVWSNIEYLEENKAIKNNPEKKKLIEEKKEMAELLKKKENKKIESLIAKYEDYDKYEEYLDFYSKKYTIDRMFLEDYLHNMLEENVDRDFTMLSPKSKVLEAVHRIILSEERYLKRKTKIGENVDLLQYSDGKIEISSSEEDSVNYLKLVNKD